MKFSIVEDSKKKKKSEKHVQISVTYLDQLRCTSRPIVIHARFQIYLFPQPLDLGF